jgi:hypothetical protein
MGWKYYIKIPVTSFLAGMAMWSSIRHAERCLVFEIDIFPKDSEASSEVPSPTSDRTQIRPLVYVHKNVSTCGVTSDVELGQRVPDPFIHWSSE